VRINGAEYGARDGIAIHGHSILRIDAIKDVELVMVDSAQLFVKQFCRIPGLLAFNSFRLAGAVLTTYAGRIETGAVYWG
jgi:hypothetical protein